MKKILAALLLAALVGCTSSTEYGQCVGAFDEKDPKLTYKVSAVNVAMAVIFFSLVAPPIFVIVDETFCPVGRK
jgi:hypothetical protein